MSDRLTQKQEKFCLEYIRCPNASDAYRQSYNAEKMKPESVNRKAFELLQNVKIASRIDSLRAKSAEIAVLTQAGVIADLMKIKDHAMAKDSLGMMLKPGEAIRALELLGKHLGMFKEKVESDKKVEIVITGGFTREMFGGSIEDPEA